MRLELLFEEAIGLALVDEQVGQARAAGDQRTGVIGGPRLEILAEIVPQRLFAPRAVHRLDDRRTGRNRAEAVGGAQRDSESTRQEERRVGTESGRTCNYQW